MISRCWSSRRGRWPAAPWPDSSPRGRATRTSGPRRRASSSTPSTSRASPAVFMDPEQGGYIRGPQELRAGPHRLRAGLGGCRRGHLQPGREPGPRAHPRAGHARAARGLHAAGQPAAAGRESADLARRLQSDGALALRRGRDGPALRGKVRVAEWKDGRGAPPPGGQARPLHHQHGLRQLRHGGGGLGGPPDQGKLHDHPGGNRPRDLRPRRPHPEAGPPALLDAGPRLQPAGPGQPDHRRLHA